LKRTRIFGFAPPCNDDASTFELPEYVHSRIQPQIFLYALKLMQAPQRPQRLRLVSASAPNRDDEPHIEDKLRQAIVLTLGRDALTYADEL
jgi:hypothetical protein